LSKDEQLGNTVMKIFIHYGLMFFVLTCFLIACATTTTQDLAKTPIMHAQAEIPEEELLDVGIMIFESSEITDKKAKKEGTNPDVRTAESHYIPYHLKNTLQQSSYWGMVRVLPVESDSADVFIKGEIIESNGENLAVKITVTDSTGKVWLEKRYKATVNGDAYRDNIPLLQSYFIHRIPLGHIRENDLIANNQTVEHFDRTH
jgi:hypothetical protein